ncbi:hypothetical protein IV203_013434 [Nitzschia inconspicua]|uniref:Uncharacterized protein n=1 Tax=Nitzschia inconspicua TaxID=303405 RepID=A0A9K3QA56_9STRA|nr:hypothetical protein IV203_013434 [Nitzschia inconspicua]
MKAPIRKTVSFPLAFIVMQWCLQQVTIVVDAFQPLVSSERTRVMQLFIPSILHPTFCLHSASKSDTTSSGEYDDDQDKQSLSAPSSSSKSSMNEYVARFLDKDTPALRSSSEEIPFDISKIQNAQLDDIADATHLIAIPMEKSHELMIELESVQRAILYHCPILLDACITAATTRLPLLYIQAGAGGPSSSGRVTMALGKLVDRLVQKHIFQVESNPDDKNLNMEGYRPLTMTFKTLEIEGDNNSILSTVGFLENDAEDDDQILESTTSFARFTNFMQDLQSAIAAQGWKMAFPPDPNNDKAKNDFRPRIAFMELPTSFDDNISRFKSSEEKLTDEEMAFLSSSQGGNGISPIFWCQWWDDVFARNVRMREIGIYSRNQMNGIQKRHSQFYAPYETILLPNGSPSMLQNERKFQEYQEQRLEEEQDLVYQANKESDPDAFVPPKTKFASNTTTSSNSTENDMLMTKTRERLERIFLESGGDVDIDLQELVNEETTNVISSQLSEAVNVEEQGEEDDVDLRKPFHPIQPKDVDYMENWMKERIKKAVNSLESVKVLNPEPKKNVPPIEENPVFKAYKDGTLVPREPRSNRKVKELGPYPGNDHFVGIWRVVSSPTGFDVDDSDETTSENLILRVDGTTAGGPTLNLETRQKASGGTWKILTKENGDVFLRIRLVIPPEKNRILVMEGLVQRMGSQGDIPTARRTFGIPEVEERAKRGSQNDLQLMTCLGKVHIQDAVTKKNREEIGEFSLMKLHGPKDRNDYTITIPKPVRNLT